jgi:L-seryl-tRNA(Ser) seleniumtransferase
MFRDPGLLRQEHPTYLMLCTPLNVLEERARRFKELLAATTPLVDARIEPAVAYLGSGSLPTQQVPSVAVGVSIPGLSANEFARRLRLDSACVFGRIENDEVKLDMRTLTDGEATAAAAAVSRIARLFQTSRSGPTP